MKLRLKQNIFFELQTKPLGQFWLHYTRLDIILTLNAVFLSCLFWSFSPIFNCKDQLISEAIYLSFKSPKRQFFEGFLPYSLQMGQNSSKFFVCFLGDLKQIFFLRLTDHQGKRAVIKAFDIQSLFNLVSYKPH